MNARSILSTNLLRLGAGALGLAAVGVLLVQGSEAAFNASTTNTGNGVAAGTVALSDSDGSANGGTGTAMFNVGNLNGGQTITRCITVSYSGTLAADIKLFGTGSGDLAPGLATTIDVGTASTATGVTTGGANFDCAGFTKTSTLVSANSLAYFGANHNSYLTGLGDGTVVTAGTTKAYKITMVVADDNAYQGKTATASFTWEAQGRDAETGNQVNGANTVDVNKPAS